MPIIEMKKVFLLGHRQEREEIFSILQQFGNVQLTDVKSGSSWDEFKSILDPEQADSKTAETDSTLSEIKFCLEFFQRHFPIRKNFVQQFTGAKLEITSSDYINHISRLEEINMVHSACRKAEDELAHLRNEETQHNSLIEELKPWENFKLPLEEASDGSHVSKGLYTVAADQIETIINMLNESLYAYILDEISEDSEYIYFFFVCLLEEAVIAREIFKEKTVSLAAFPSLKGTAADNMKNVKIELENLVEKRNVILTEVEKLLEYRPMLMTCYDFMFNEYQKHEAVGNLARTENSFLLEGWVPAPVLDDLENLLAGKTETAVIASRDPEYGEEVPVLLHNSGPAEAYEVVTKLYSTPRKKELDPTPFLAPFFFIFFGICLSDAGYGFVLALLALFISRKLRLTGMGGQLLKLLIYGGISSIVFGVLLGSYFGDLLKLPPLWFNPLDDPMRMLFYCFGIGLIHLYFGMSLQAYRNIKAGQSMSAIFDQGFWFIFLNGLILLLIPEFSAAGRWLAIGGAAGLILTQGRAQQGIIKKFLSGLLSLYNVTGYLSDVLSYSRLLALGLATGVIASAINSMGGMISGGIIGTIIMAIVLFGGHIFNIIISTLGSYVHTSRLQYIEFFSKFFEGGGKAFQPFGIKNSYIEVANTDK
ncbi:MAG: V-type ATP synthase subunit I [Bacillota bacterium]|nr:V-type ATP synthase subunit I [Bacillota bacterium]